MINRRIIFAYLAVMALVWAGIATTTVSAKDASITVAAGDTARIPLRLWCTEFGKPFPKAVSGPTGRAPDPVVKALLAAEAKGTTQSDPFETQLAIWKAADGTFHDTPSEGHAVAQQLITDSQTMTISSAPASSMLETIMAQNTLSVTVENLTPVNDTAHFSGNPYSGKADLVVKNTSSQSVTFTFVDGALFKPASNSDQILIAEPLALQQGTGTPAATGTGVATGTSVATGTTAATSAPATAAATSTTAATNTAAPTNTVAPTNTTAPTNTVAPTMTNTPAPTNTSAPTPAPQTAPTTGGNPGDASFFILFAVGLLFVSSGVLVLSRRNIKR